jgi:DNA-binding response OmpR family regulator
VILDLRLPGIGGEAVLAKLRAERPRQAIIMLSGISEVADKVRLLNLGADDYITKPFALPELLARVVARLRALAEQTDGPVPGPAESCSTANAGRWTWGPARST